MPKRHALRPGARGEEVIGAVIGALVGYMAAEAILTPFMHPLHWLTSIIVGGVAYVGVLLWYRWRYPRRSGPHGTKGKHSAASPWYRRWWRGRRP